jgi:hypothetical protein
MVFSLKEDVHSPHEGIQGRATLNWGDRRRTGASRSKGGMVKVSHRAHVAHLGMRKGSMACTTGCTSRGTDKVS